MTGPAGSARPVEIAPLSARAELVNVVCVVLAIVAGVGAYLAADGPGFAAGAPAQRNLLPFQALVEDRPSTEQRVFRELQEGLLEAEARRAATGAWPSVSALAEEGIPPFAADPTAKGSQYDWHLIENQTFVNYLGIPRQQEAPAWLLLVLEPEPGAPPDPAGESEEHHRLASGEMLHVSTWVQANGDRLGHRIVPMPQAEGWTQLQAIAPSASLDRR